MSIEPRSAGMEKIEEISESTMNRLTEYAWPGNIRELENVLERGMILSPGSTLLLEPLLEVFDQGPSLRQSKPDSVDNVL